MSDVTAAQLKEFEDWIAKKNGKKGSKKNGTKKTLSKREATTEKPEPKARKRATKRSKAGSGKTTKGVKKRATRRRKPGFSEETRKLAHLRAEDLCENPLCRRSVPNLGGEHHCIPRSQYHKSDRNDVWNCACICQTCHERVTTPKSDEDKRLRRYFERRAYSLREYSGDQLSRELEALDQALKDNVLDMVRSFAPLVTDLA